MKAGSFSPSHRQKAIRIFETMIATPSLNEGGRLSSLVSDGSNPPALAARLRPLYTEFFKDLDLKPAFERFESQRLMKEVLEHATKTGVPHPPNSQSYQCLMVGYSYADVGPLFPQ